MSDREVSELQRRADVAVESYREVIAKARVAETREEWTALTQLLADAKERMDEVLADAGRLLAGRRRARGNRL